MYKTCHTEESSRRQRMLEQGLLEALESQSYQKITLTAGEKGELPPAVRREGIRQR